MLVCVQIFNKRSKQHETQPQTENRKHTPETELLESELDQVVGGLIGDKIGLPVRGKSKHNGESINSIPASDSKVIAPPAGNGW